MNGALIQSRIWKGYGKCAKRIGFDCKFYRPGNPPVNTGTLDTPGCKWDDAGKQFDPETGLYDDPTKSFDNTNSFDQPGNPDTFDQTKFDSAGATLDDGLDWDAPGNYLFTLPVSLNAEDMSYGKPNKYGKATWYALVDGTDLEVGLYFKGQEGTFFIAALQPLLPILAVECNRIVRIERPFSNDGVGIGQYGGAETIKNKLIVSARPCSILQGTKGEKAEAGLPGDTRMPWWIILMPYAGTDIFMDDILIDDLGRRYIVSSCEISDLGYRISATQAAP